MIQRDLSCSGVGPAHPCALLRTAAQIGRAQHQGCVGCEDNSLRLQSDKRESQTHRHGLEAPPLRHLRAAAAIEREDRAASSSALHVVFPTIEVTKRGAARKSGRRFLTRDAAARVAAEVGFDLLPQRSGARLTCYRDTGNFVSHVTGTQREFVTHVTGTHRR